MAIILDKASALKLGISTEKPSKYRNEKTVVDGIKFDSKKEANRYAELKVLERVGAITNLRLQVPFLLIPTLKDEKGKVLERAVYYKADFVYLKGKQTVVEDVKGKKTKEYILKRKIMLLKYKIKIKEIE